MKDQDFFRSGAAQSSLLQSAELISVTEACKGRSGPGSALIGTLRSLFMPVPQLTKLRVHQGSQRESFKDVLDKLRDRINPVPYWLTVG